MGPCAGGPNRPNRDCVRIRHSKHPRLDGREEYLDPIILSPGISPQQFGQGKILGDVYKD